MRHDAFVAGKLCNLRPVEIGDASFINEIRGDPSLTRYLHKVSGKLADQEKWLQSYFDRENDYYFIIEDRENRRPVGTIGLYDIDLANNNGEWGRWLLAPGSLFATESALLIYRFALDVLKLDDVFCRTVSDNQQVVSFHESCGLEQTGILKGFHELGDRTCDAVEHKLTKERWRGVEPHLSRIVGRLSSRRKVS